MKKNSLLISIELEELEVLRSAIVEVLYGLDIDDCETRTGFGLHDFEKILSNIDGL